MFDRIIKTYRKIFKKKIKRISYIEVLNKETGQWVKVKAKADSGACNNSIDRVFAEKIGFKKTVEDFEKVDEQIKAERKKKKRTRIKKINKLYLDQISGASKLVVVKSTHGASVRVQVKIIVRIKGRIIKTSANIYNRKKMKIHFLIGQSVLKYFYIKI